MNSVQLLLVINQIEKSIFNFSKKSYGLPNSNIFGIRKKFGYIFFSSKWYHSYCIILSPVPFLPKWIIWVKRDEFRVKRNIVPFYPKWTSLFFIFEMTFWEVIIYQIQTAMTDNQRQERFKQKTGRWTKIWSGIINFCAIISSKTNNDKNDPL